MKHPNRSYNSVMRRTGLGLAFAGIATGALLFGCASTAGPPPSGKTAAEPPAGGDVNKAQDTARGKSLKQIEPVVTKPKRPPDLAPVSERSATQIASARDLMAQQRYTEAAIKLERALRYDPDHPEIHGTLAWLHWQAGNLERARSHARRAIEVNPDLAAAQFIVGRAHAMDGDQTAAITAYRTALMCSDFDADHEVAALIHFHLAESLRTQDYLHAAVGQYQAFRERLALLKGQFESGGRAAVSAKPSALVLEPTALRALSDVLEELGRYADAADAMHALIEAAGRDAAKGIRYARLLLKAGRVEQALSAARAVRDDSDEVFELLLDIYERAGRSGEIVGELKNRIATRPDDANLVVRLADLLVRLDRTDDAIGELDAFLQRHADARRVRARLVDLLVARRQWDRALQLAADGIAEHEQPAERYVKRLAPLAKDADAVRALSEDTGELGPALAYLRAALLERAGRTEPAVALFRRSFDADPNFIPSRVALAELHLRSYAYQQALQVAARREADTPESARLEQLLGQIYDRLDEYDKAEQHYRTAIRLDRGDTRSMLLLARLFDRQRKANLAQRQLQVLLDIDPHNEEARELLAMLYLAEGKPDVAFEQLDRLKRASNNVTTIARCESVLDNRLRSDSEARRQHLLEAIEKGEPDAATWLAVARTYNEFQPEPARDAYRKALKLEPDNEQALLGLAQTLQRLLQYEAAARQMEKLLRIRPNRDPWRMTLIELKSIVQDFATALTLARQGEQDAQSNETWRFRYRLAILELLRDQGRNEQIIAELENWALAETDNKEWSARLAEEYLRQERYDEAVARFEKLHRAQPDDWSALGRLLNALAAAEAYERAAQYVLDRLQRDPENDTGVWMLAALLADADRLDDAIEIVRNRLLHAASREPFQNFMLDRLRAADRHEESVEYVEALLHEAASLLGVHQREGGAPRLDEPDPLQRINWPDHPTSPGHVHERVQQLQLQLGLGLVEAGEYRRAESRITEWLEATRDPQSRHRYLRLLAHCQRRMGDEARATESLHRALLIQPDDPLLNNDVAYAWIDQGIRLDEAEPMIRYALWRRPQEAAYLDTYGWLMYKKGDFAEARTWLERAEQAHQRDDPVIFDHLGDTFWRLGKTEQAVAYWEKAREMVEQRREEERPFISDDERRVRDTIEQKLEDARAGRTPSIAALGSTNGADGNADGG